MLKHIEIKSIFFLFTFFFIIAFGYFYWYGTYVLFFQENQSLFILSYNHLYEFASKPGGLIVFISNFLTQFYINPLIGSLIIAVIISLTGFIFYKTARLIHPNSPVMVLFAFLPSGVLLLMQTHYFHLMEYNLGFLLVLLFFMFSVSPEKKSYPLSVLLLFPLFYYIAGAFAIVYLGLYLFYCLLFHRGKFMYLYMILLLGVAVTTYFLFKNVLFLVPSSHLFKYPFPFVNDSKHELLLIIYVGLLALFLILLRLKGLSNLIKKKQVFYPASALPVLFLIIYFLSELYNPQTDRVLQIEKLIVQEKWQEAIDFQENFPAENLIGQYFYNVALAETNQLTSRLFYGRQDFNANSLILPWDKEYLNWGAHFFYTVGLVNEAHRWAYEEMVVYGKRPVNMQLLVKTNLINGNYKRAETFLSELKKTIHYSTWAKEYEKLLVDTTLIPSHPEIGSKREILPHTKFVIEVSSPQNNLPLLLNANPMNKKACEYLMAWLLLTKDVTTLMNNLGILKELEYKNIPRHIEEAILAYYNNTRKFPELHGYKISEDTNARYKQYVSVYNDFKNNPALLKSKLEEGFGNTFWFYFHFK